MSARKQKKLWELVSHNNKKTTAQSLLLWHPTNNVKIFNRNIKINAPEADVSVRASTSKQLYAATCCKQATDARLSSLAGAASAFSNSPRPSRRLSRRRWRARPACTQNYLRAGHALPPRNKKSTCMYACEWPFGIFQHYFFPGDLGMAVSGRFFIHFCSCIDSLIS